MSIITEALKKAEESRSQGQAISKRDGKDPAQAAIKKNFVMPKNRYRSINLNLASIFVIIMISASLFFIGKLTVSTLDIISSRKTPTPSMETVNVRLAQKSAITKPLLTDSFGAQERLFREDPLAKQKAFQQNLPSSLSLQGIMHEESGSMVLINGVVLEAGDSIAGAFLEDILDDEVVLSYGDEKFYLRVR